MGSVVTRSIGDNNGLTQCGALELAMVTIAATLERGKHSRPISGRVCSECLDAMRTILYDRDGQSLVGLRGSTPFKMSTGKEQ